jgi:hypothetical protein
MEIGEARKVRIGNGWQRAEIRGRRAVRIENRQMLVIVPSIAIET